MLAAGQDPSHSIHVSTPPQDARACVSTLLAADAILSAADLRTTLAPLAPVENRTRSGIDPKRHRSWETAFRRYQDDCPQRFQNAAEYLASTHRRSGKGGSRLPQRGLEYGPQHVAAFLPLACAGQNKQPYYQQMKPLLDTYAAQLTKAVDVARSSRQLARSLAN